MRKFKQFAENSMQCPTCYSPGTYHKHGEMYAEKTELYMRMRCRVCGAAWIEKYLLSGLAVTEYGEKLFFKMRRVQ